MLHIGRFILHLPTPSVVPWMLKTWLQLTREGGVANIHEMRARAGRMHILGKQQRPIERHEVSDRGGYTHLSSKNESAGYASKSERLVYMNQVKSGNMPLRSSRS